MLRADKDLAFMLKYENIAWYENGKVRILDRRIYPAKSEFVICKRHEEVAKSIADMVTQSGGPYIAAGMGMALAAFEAKDMNQEKTLDYLTKASYTLSNARPTTIKKMEKVVDECLLVAKNAVKSGESVDEAIFKHTLDTLNNKYIRIGKTANYLVDMFPDKGSIMTQCFGETIVGLMLKEAKNREKI